MACSRLAERRHLQEYFSRCERVQCVQIRLEKRRTALEMRLGSSCPAAAFSWRSAVWQGRRE
eukprot:3341471-Prorocentrum_lima.AAC.1